MLLPEIKDDKNWYGGLDFGFVDKEKRFIYAFTADVTPPSYVNRSSVPTNQLNHLRQLIDPKFKAKIVMDDRRTAGGGSVDLATLMVAFGEDFISKLLAEQQMVFSRDSRQMADWFVRGTYPIAISLPLQLS